MSEEKYTTITSHDGTRLIVSKPQWRNLDELKEELLRRVKEEGVAGPSDATVNAAFIRERCK